jgi:hypothetical protein
MSRFCVIAIAGAVTLAGCSGFIQRRAASSTHSVMKRSSIAVQRGDDIELARAAAPGGLVQLEAFHLAYPGHRGFVELLAEGYCQYASGFLNDDWERAVLGGDGKAAMRLRTRTLRLLDRCIDYGLTLLGSDWKAAYARGPAAMSRMVAAAGKSDVQGMTWVAVGIATAIGMNPLDLGRLRFLSVTEAMLDRVVALDEDFRDATAHVLLGALDSSRPRFLGGNPEAGKRHFARARALTRGGSLMVDVVFARTYAVATKNRALFRKTLQRVLQADPTRWPERRLANEMAKAKARTYLAAEERIFKPSSALGMVWGR